MIANEAGVAGTGQAFVTPVVQDGQSQFEGKR